MKNYIHDNFGNFSWDKVKMENQCGYAGPPINVSGGAATEIMKYTPTQDFISHYFTPQNPLKGMLLYQSVGTGKTCTAIATATSAFEKQGYTILWVTRTTLKNDIWKNMFEQTCSELIREAVLKGDKIPSEQNKRMRLLSKSWKIRPMSYKQFSNLVSKQNQYYNDLVKINGETDPLYKTLIIIDEAHKLYGGGDLSSLEKPDMDALHKSLMNSYLTSGSNSVKLLLMTATPITTDPFELVKLVNLCKLPVQQIPTDYKSFSDEYLEDTGYFSKKGEELFLDNIAGHISYLNREKDARQFSQPIMTHVDVPIVDEKKTTMIKQYDKYYIKEESEKKINSLQEELELNNRELENDLKDIDSGKFSFLKKKCDDFDDPTLNKKCASIVKKHIQEIVKDTKQEAAVFKDKMKSIKTQMKTDIKSRTNELKKIRERINENPEEYEHYKDSTYYNLKFNCSKSIKDVAEINKVVKEHPAIVEADKLIDDLENNKKDAENNLKIVLDSYKNKIENTQKLLKSHEINDLEKNVVKMVVKEMRTDFNKTKRKEMKNMTTKMKDLNDNTRKMQKWRGNVIMKIKKTLKNRLKKQLVEEKNVKKVEEKLRKSQRKQGIIENEIKNELVKTIVDKHSSMMDQELKNLKREKIAILWDRVQKERKKKEMEAEKIKIKELKMEEKTRNIRRKENLRKTRKLDKEKEKQEREKAKQEREKARDKEIKARDKQAREKQDKQAREKQDKQK